MRRKICNRNRNVIAHPCETYYRESTDIIDLTSTQASNDAPTSTPLLQAAHQSGDNAQLENARLTLGLQCSPSVGYVSLPVWGVPLSRRLLRWTEGEDTFLQSIMYNSPIPWWDVMRVLPHRTRSTISQRMVMLRALARNVRRELDLVLANRDVEVIVVDDDDGVDGRAATRSASDDTGDGDARRESVSARDVHDTAVVRRDHKRVENGNGVLNEESRVIREEVNIKQGYVPSADKIRGICERAEGVEHVPEDAKQESDEEGGLIGAKRVAELLNEEGCDDEQGDDFEEFVFVASPRDGEEAFDRRGCGDLDKIEKVEMVEKVGFADRKRENGINDCDYRKRRKKDESVVVT